MAKVVVIGIDLAGNKTNPSGWAFWRDRAVFTCHLYQNDEVIARTFECCPNLVAVDAPLTLPRREAMRFADKEIIGKVTLFFHRFSLPWKSLLCEQQS